MDGHQYTARFEAPGGKPILQPYLDTRGIPTVGLGHTGPDVIMGQPWTYDRCMATFYSDYGIAQASASHVMGSSCWLMLNEPRRAVPIDMAFNLGSHGLAGFHNMIEAIQRGKWLAAEAELKDSDYAKQVKSRADMNAQTLLTGEWPDEIG